MKKIYLLLLFFPIGIMAQIESVKPETVKDSISNQTEKVQAAIKAIKEKVPEARTVAPVRTPVCIAGDCKNGQGTMNYKTGTYKGTWKDDLREGKGKYTWMNGDTYKGTWAKDKRHGYGVYTWHDGSVYKGNYSHGIRSGYGIYYYTNGSIYEGTWQNNLKHGIANFYYKESVNIGGRYFNNEYVGGTGINKDSYEHKPE